MRYFLRTEANCLVTLPGDDDPQRFVEFGTVLTLYDEARAADAKIADDLSHATHGWQEVDEDGSPIVRAEPPEPPWTPPEGTTTDPTVPADEGAASVDSTTT